MEDQAHFLPCIEMAKLEGKGVLLDHWFETRIIGVTCDVTRFRGKRCPHSGTRIAAPSPKLVFLIYFLWHSSCGSYRRVQRKGMRPGTHRAVIKEDAKICVETRFEHR